MCRKQPLQRRLQQLPCDASYRAHRRCFGVALRLPSRVYPLKKMHKRTLRMNRLRYPPTDFDICFSGLRVQQRSVPVSAWNSHWHVCALFVYTIKEFRLTLRCSEPYTAARNTEGLTSVFCSHGILESFSSAGCRTVVPHHRGRHAENRACENFTSKFYHLMTLRYPPSN